MKSFSTVSRTVHGWLVQTWVLSNSGPGVGIMRYRGLWWMPANEELFGDMRQACDVADRRDSPLGQ